MIDDKIINFITDNYKEYNDSFNINDYSNEQLFTDVHTIELYKVFDNLKTYIIKYYVLSDNSVNIPIYFNKKYKDFINFLIPNTYILKQTILYNYNLSDSEINQIYTKIFEDIQQI